eukprot:TRINITY_DN72868_c0_g1_i1.p1 TRINITY_DN72868_c0_g1~~TRINITY_DN72868_c0_g1_i1.p1  ORF type:complete len:280 (-),score=83.76 TRINITY_DN72868_c0_g1_i1:115-954(-)
MGNANLVSEEARKTIVAVGVTGSGKSTTCNLISGSKIFDEDHGFNSTTSAALHCDAMRSGMPVRAIDTVGFLSNVDAEEAKMSKFAQFSEMTPFGVDVFMLMEKYGRWTLANDRHFQLFREFAGEDALKHTLLVFTHVNNKDLQRHLQADQLPDGLKEVLSKVAGVVGIENKQAPRAALSDLSKALCDIVEKNAGARYSNECIHKATEKRAMLKKRIEALRSPQLQKMLNDKMNHLHTGLHRFEELEKEVEHAEAQDKGFLRGKGTSSTTTCCVPTSMA